MLILKFYKKSQTCENLILVYKILISCNSLYSLSYYVPTKKVNNCVDTHLVVRTPNMLVPVLP